MVPAPRRASLAEWGIDRDKVVVGMVACFKPQKSPVDFVKVAAGVLEQRDDVHFVMIGDGELREDIENKIAESGIGDDITLLGWRRDMPEVYRNLDVLVLTSLWEGLPRVFAEAMANELPIVATNVDGASEAIIDGKTGYLHRPHDIEGMTQSVLRLVSAPEERQSMGEEGRSRVVEFEIGTSQSKLEETYRECLAAL